MKNKNKMNLLPFVYLIFSIYLVNVPFNFLKAPEFLMKFNNWIIVFGGVLLFVAFCRSILYSEKRIVKKMMKRSRF